MRRYMLAVPLLAAMLASAQHVPRVDPAHALAGAELVAQLRRGGFVLFMRHAQHGGTQTTEPCQHDNLVPEGHDQARIVGTALRALRVSIGTLRSSPVCRAIQTAERLGVGEVRTTADLNPGMDPNIAAARAVLLAQPPPPGTNALLVSHVQSGRNEADRISLEIGEVIVYRPDGRGATAPVARIRVEQWEGLLAHQ